MALPGIQKRSLTWDTNLENHQHCSWYLKAEKYTKSLRAIFWRKEFEKGILKTTYIPEMGREGIALNRHTGVACHYWNIWTVCHYRNLKGSICKNNWSTLLNAISRKDNYWDLTVEFQKKVVDVLVKELFQHSGWSRVVVLKLKGKVTSKE